MSTIDIQKLGLPSSSRMKEIIEEDYPAVSLANRMRMIEKQFAERQTEQPRDLSKPPENLQQVFYQFESVFNQLLGLMKRFIAINLNEVRLSNLNQIVQSYIQLSSIYNAFVSQQLPSNELFRRQIYEKLDMLASASGQIIQKLSSGNLTIIDDSHGIQISPNATSDYINVFESIRRDALTRNLRPVSIGSDFPLPGQPRNFVPMQIGQPPPQPPQPPQPQQPINVTDIIRQEPPQPFEFLDPYAPVDRVPDHRVTQPLTEEQKVLLRRTLGFIDANPNPSQLEEEFLTSPQALEIKTNLEELLTSPNISDSIRMKLMSYKDLYNIVWGEYHDPELSQQIWGDRRMDELQQEYLEDKANEGRFLKGAYDRIKKEALTNPEYIPTLEQATMLLVSAGFNVNEDGLIDFKRFKQPALGTLQQRQLTQGLARLLDEKMGYVRSQTSTLKQAHAESPLAQKMNDLKQLYSEIKRLGSRSIDFEPVLVRANEILQSEGFEIDDSGVARLDRPTRGYDSKKLTKLIYELTRLLGFRQIGISERDTRTQEQLRRNPSSTFGRPPPGNPPGYRPKSQQQWGAQGLKK